MPCTKEDIIKEVGICRRKDSETLLARTLARFAVEWNRS